MSAGPLIRLAGVEKIYNTGGAPVHALRALDLDIPRGQYLAIMGPSGSGKSTLLNLLGMLDRPTAGHYHIGLEDAAALDDDALSALRCRSIGFIFQSFNLIPQLTVLENVAVPLQYADAPVASMRERAMELLRRVGLEDRWAHRPNQLSGGQCQRVAIARALANDPAILLADEPTGNLDERTGREILALFGELHRDGHTLIMVTHNPEYRGVVERVVTLHDGRMTGDERGSGARGGA